MFLTGAVRTSPAGRPLLITLIASLLTPLVAECASSVTLAWEASQPSASVATYRVYLGMASRDYTSFVTVSGTSTSGTVNGLEAGNIYYLAVTAVNAAGFESTYSPEVVFTNSLVTDPLVNRTPTLNAIGSRSINENSGLQTVALSGISAGPGENQNLTITATSSNPALIPHPTVQYLSPNTSGTLSFQPVDYQYGFASITVTVNDGEAQNGTFTRTFNVVVNDRPFISGVYDQVLTPGVAASPIPFTISDTETTAPNLMVSATSSLESLLPGTNIIFFGTNEQRFVTLTPLAGATGTSTVALAVSDGMAVSTTTFRLIVAEDGVEPVTGAPSISGLTNVVMEKSTTAGPIPFMVWDTETPADKLTLEALSSVPALVPISGVVFGGSGTNRTVQVTPAPGQSGETTIAVTVSDGGTVTTASFRVTVLSVSQSHVQIATNGKGTVLGSYGSQPLLVGSTYTITAIPEPGQVFTGWGGSIVSSSPRLTFTAQPTMELKANFAAVDKDPVSARFNGLFREEAGVKHDSSGSFVLKTTSKGSYSGSIRLGKERRSFQGSFAAGYNQATNEWVLENGRSLVVEFSLIEGASRVVGRITEGTWESPLVAYRHVSEIPAKAGAFEGIYTLAIPSQNAPNQPGGHSYATVRVNRKGMVTFAGRMADGTKLTQSAVLSAEGKWPFHASLYSREGSMLSWISFSESATSDISGTFHWFKPKRSKGAYLHGFSLQSEAVGSLFVAGQTSLPPAPRVIFGGAIAAPIVESLTLDDRGRLVPNTGSRMSFKLSKSGLFSGVLKDPASGDRWRFGGAVLQKQQMGYGFTASVDQTGPVRITP